MKWWGWGRCLLGVWLFSCLPCSEACADGGTVRWSERVEGYQITVFTSPTPFRAGPVDVSILVQDAKTGASIPDAEVVVRMATVDPPYRALGQSASRAAATNKLLYAAKFELPAAGWWDVEVSVKATSGYSQCRFQVEAAEARPRWVEMWGWITLPVVPVLMFLLHQILVRRAQATS